MTALRSLLAFALLLWSASVALAASGATIGMDYNTGPLPRVCVGVSPTLRCLAAGYNNNGAFVPAGMPAATMAQFPSAAAAFTALANGGTLTLPNGYNTTFSGLPYGAVFEYMGPHVRVNDYAESGEVGNYANRVLQGYLAGGHATPGQSGSSTQTLMQIEAVSLGSGAIGANLADYALVVSHLKQNWTTTQIPGEGDVLSCNMRWGGPTSGVNAGQSDNDCFLVNMAHISGSGYSAMFEGTNQDIDPTSFAALHAIGVQLGVNDSRDGDREGVIIAAQYGVANVGFHTLVGAGASFQDFLRNDALCSGASTTNFRVRAADGAIIWTACGFPSGGMTLANPGGTLTVYNNAATPVFTVDQGANLVTGSLKINSTWMLASATAFPNGAGSGSATLSNAPVSGNPTKWVSILDAGVTRYIPSW